MKLIEMRASGRGAAGLIAVLGCLVQTGCVGTTPVVGGETTTVTGPGFFYTRTEVRKTSAPPAPGTPAAQQFAIALAAATVIATKLQEVTDNCEALGRAEYQVDCLGEGYDRVSRSISADNTFTDARNALAQAAGRLNALADSARTDALPDIAVKGAGRRVAAVDPAKLADVRNQAAKIIEETETVLLRSSGGTPEKEASYQKIVAAVDSAKYLLRSA